MGGSRCRVLGFEVFRFWDPGLDSRADILDALGLCYALGFKVSGFGVGPAWKGAQASAPRPRQIPLSLSLCLSLCRSLSAISVCHLSLSSLCLLSFSLLPHLSLSSLSLSGTWIGVCTAAALQTPYTLHPAPYNPRPAPYTLHPTPCTLHPAPYTLHPTPFTRHPAPCTLHATPYTLHPAPALRRRPSTFSSLSLSLSLSRARALSFWAPAQ